MSGCLTISWHADREALLETAVLAPVPIHAHDQTVLILHAHLVVDVLLDAASEKTLTQTDMFTYIPCETRAQKKSTHIWNIPQFFHISFWLLPYLASLACMHSIVETRCNVATDFAKQDHSTCLWGRKVNCEISCKNTHICIWRNKYLCISTVRKTYWWKFPGIRMAFSPQWGVHRNAVE